MSYHRFPHSLSLSLSFAVCLPTFAAGNAIKWETAHLCPTTDMLLRLLPRMRSLISSSVFTVASATSSWGTADRLERIATNAGDWYRIDYYWRRELIWILIPQPLDPEPYIPSTMARHCSVVARREKIGDGESLATTREGEELKTDGSLGSRRRSRKVLIGALIKSVVAATRNVLPSSSASPPSSSSKIHSKIS